MIRRGSGCRTIAMILPVSVCLWFSVSTTAALTVTPSPTQQGSITLTRTPTPSPTSCGVETPIVDPVLSPTTLLQQTITGMARVTGARSISITSEGGIARMDCNEGECGSSFALTINLLPNQTNHLTVCNSDEIYCGGPVNACTRFDRNGNPLDIVQIFLTPTPTITRTPTPEGTITLTVTPTPTWTATWTPTFCPTGTPCIPGEFAACSVPVNYCDCTCQACPVTCAPGDSRLCTGTSFHPNTCESVCTCVTPTPTPTACETFPPPTLTFQFSMEPAHPVVGDQVQLSFSVSGRGGIPAYTLSGAAPVFQGDTSTITSDQLGTVTYHLTAVQAGTATLSLSVNCETSIGCVDQPIYQFVSDTSPPFSVEVMESSAPTPTFTTTPTPTCHPIVGLTDCQVDGDCVVVNQIDCCPCSSGGHQAAINQTKQDELSQQLEVCCAAAGVCLPVYQCEDNLAAVCESGTCTLVNTSGTPTPTPTPTGVVIGIGDFCEPDRICPSPLRCLIDPPHQARVCSCVGDCDGDAEVTINELITLVNVALGNMAGSVCPLGDANSDGQITIDEILQAVTNALYGCGATLPTPTPTPTPFVLPSPNGEFLCSVPGGVSPDGKACNGDADCAPDGVCVIAQGVCNGGTDDGFPCDCAGGMCRASTPVCDATFTGVCQGGSDATLCCRATTNCSDSAPCVGAQKVCLAGDDKGHSCLNDPQCPGSVCRSTGNFCSGGDFDSYSCVDNNDCTNTSDGTTGVCRAAAVMPTPTPTPLPGLGAYCHTGDQCTSGFCTDGVCCEVRSCPLPERCDSFGYQGVCRPEPPLGGPPCRLNTDCNQDFGLMCLYCVTGPPDCPTAGQFYCGVPVPTPTPVTLPTPTPTPTATLPICDQPTPRPDVPCPDEAMPCGACSYNSCRLNGRDGHCDCNFSSECTCDTEGPTATATPVCVVQSTPTPTSCVEDLQCHFPFQGGCYAHPYLGQCGLGCTPTNVCMPAEGGSACVDVIAPDTCCWSVTQNDLIQSLPPITSGQQGCGNGRVCYQVGNLSGGEYCATWAIQVQDHSFTIGQYWTTPTVSSTATPTPLPIR